MANVPPISAPGLGPGSAQPLAVIAHRGYIINESDVARLACFLDRGGVTVFMIHVKVQCDWWLY